MRKKEREITDPREIDDILKRATVVRVAFAAESEPYIVPLSYGFDAGSHRLFVHTATEGRKIEFIGANPRVCFEIEGRVSLQEKGKQGCAWGLKYESVVGYGRMVEVVDPIEKDSALRMIMRQQSHREDDWTFAPKVLAMTRIWAIEIDSATGKRSF